MPPPPPGPHAGEPGAQASQKRRKEDIEKLMDVLQARTKCHRMLIARELSVLIPGFPQDAADRVACVGGGAAGVDPARRVAPGSPRGALSHLLKVLHFHFQRFYRVLIDIWTLLMVVN